MAEADEAASNVTMWVRMMGVEIRTIGNKYRGRCAVAGDGPPLILLHGQGGHLENFSRNIEPLSASFRVYAPDFVWHGYGPQPAFDPRLIPIYREQVLDLMDAEGIDQAFIVGQSMGGWTALKLAIENPDRMRSLILVNPQGTHLPAGSDGPEVMPSPGPAALERQLGILDEPVRENIRARLSGLFFRPEEFLDEEMIEVRMKIYNNPISNNSLRQVVSAYMAGPGSPVAAQAITPDDLSSIRVPTLLFWGGENSVPPEAGERIHRLIPNSKFYCEPDTGHWAQDEAWEAHNREVSAFVQTLL